MPLGLGALTRAVCNRARRGLYAGRRVLAGNQISEDGGNKSRRTWKPNAHNKRLYSEVLGHRLSLRVTAAALRDIDKAGGIDAYILNTPDSKLQSDVAIKLRQRIVQGMLATQRRLARQQAADERAVAAAAAEEAKRWQRQQLSPAAAAAAAAAAEPAAA